MSDTRTIRAALPTAVADALDDYQRDHDLTRSEALAALLLVALDTSRAPAAVEGGPLGFDLLCPGVQARRLRDGAGYAVELDDGSVRLLDLSRLGIGGVLQMIAHQLRAGGRPHLPAATALAAAVTAAVTSVRQGALR